MALNIFLKRWLNCNSYYGFLKDEYYHCWIMSYASRSITYLFVYHGASSMVSKPCTVHGFQWFAFLPSLLWPHHSLCLTVLNSNSAAILFIYCCRKLNKDNQKLNFGSQNHAVDKQWIDGDIISLLSKHMT